jgi:hypothetical protein
VEDYSGALIANSLFVGEGVDVRGGAAATIEQNTFVWCEDGITILNSAASVIARHNIIVECTGGVVCPGCTVPVTLICNDVWGNQLGNYYGLWDPTGTDGNISEDPLFCNAEGDDFTLDDSSPCAPNNSPPGCGLIGVYDVGCSMASVRDGAETYQTWGTVKALLR